MQTPKTIGIIGAGDIVFSAHLPLLKAMGIETRWILDSSRKNATSLAKACGIPMVFEPGELDKTPPTDIVLIACPYGVRQLYYDFLHSRSSALYIEKPIAKTLREHNDICSLRADYGICAGFFRRSKGGVSIVKQLIESETFGKLRRVRSEFGTVTQISSGGSFAKNVTLSGGGQLFESAIHFIDAVAYCTNAASAKVLKKNMIHENGFDLHTEALIELTDGHGQSVEMDLLVTCFKNTNYEIELTFDTATLVFSLFKQAPLQLITKGGGAYSVSDALTKDLPENTYDTLFRFWGDFLKGMEAQKMNYTNLAAGRVTTQMIEQLYEA